MSAKLYETLSTYTGTADELTAIETCMELCSGAKSTEAACTAAPCDAAYAKYVYAEHPIGCKESEVAISVYKETGDAAKMTLFRQEDRVTNKLYADEVTVYAFGKN
jgi:hypothetical protein